MRFDLSPLLYSWHVLKIFYCKPVVRIVAHGFQIVVRIIVVNAVILFRVRPEL